jgi:hypothetical protein
MIFSYFWKLQIAVYGGLFTNPKDPADHAD